VRPQVTSVVTRVHIKEGQFVRKGELMFTLDARDDETNLAKAQAQLARDEAGLADANRQLQRNRELVAQNFISRGALDASQTLVESQSAARRRRPGGHRRASGSRCRMPGSPRPATGAGRQQLSSTPGSSVLANQTTLVTVTQLDPINVAFTLPQRHLADALAALKDGGRRGHGDPARRRVRRCNGSPAVRRQRGRCGFGHGQSEGGVRQPQRPACGRVPMSTLRWPFARSRTPW
jgi:multidrug efflux pump subunit AcrA (membrane-fusion protein)